MNDTPTLRTAEEIKQQEGFQALQPSRRPDWWGVDRELARRPGVPMELSPPRSWPNSRSEIDPMQVPSAVPLHGRSNKKMPKVYGTTHPLGGLGGAVKRFAYTLPDHRPTHWLLLLLGDRVELWTHRARKVLPFTLPFAALAYLVSHGQRTRPSVRARVDRAVAPPGEQLTTH